MADIAVNLATKAGEKLVERLVDTVYSSISGELSLLIGVREEVQYIIDELQIMSAFLREAEEKQAGNAAVRAWVQQVRQLSYAVEDCIDEFSLHLEQHRSKNLKVRRRIAVEIKGVKSRVQEVSKRRLRYGIIDVNNASSSEDHNVVQYDPRLAALFVEDAQLVGIDAPREKLVGWLMDETSELSLIAVVGGGGLGKTTIVRKAYEDTTVNREHFTCRAWITVSQVYHVEGLLRDMIKQFMNPSPPEVLDKFKRPQLITELLNYLKDKRYIIVFDDIWTIDAWKSLAMVLPKKDLMGSRVMLTTRNKEVAEACLSDIPGHFYPHEKLSEQQSMDLFCRRTFNDTVCPEELKEDSQDILEKCDGLPLAIVTIAGVLASRPKKTIQEWKNLLGRLGSELEGNPNLEGVKKILTLSYNDLSYPVKRCFLYLCKFPEDYVMYRKDVQRLWIVEGFVVDRRDMTAEEVAESYFNDLVNRFMILPTTFSNVSGKVKSFKVHDIMLELILSKSLDEKFVIIIGKSSVCMPHDVIRRLSTHSNHNPKNMCMSHVRSLSMFGDGITTISHSMRMLRMLDMDGCDPYSAEVGDHFLEILGQLLHLKYLRVRNILQVRLPKSLGNCRNLEILDLRGNTYTIKIPSGVTKLQQLRILRGDKLILPRGMGSLRTLQELAGVNMEKSGKHVAREIGKLTQLRKLDIYHLNGESSNDFCKSLERMSSSLRSLKVRYSYGHDCAALYYLSSPPLLLESLEISGSTGKENKLHPWVGQLNQAVRVTLGGFHLDDSDTRVLGSLPNLMKLRLAENKYDGGRLSFGAGGFPCLKTLHLEIITVDVKRVSFEEGTMPHLESITFKDYEEKTVEGPLGLKNLPSLNEVNFYYGWDDGLLWDVVSAETAEHPNHPRLRQMRAV